MPEQLNISLAQIAPVWLNKKQTIDKILAAISQAADQSSQLVAFGEGLLPGYPFWVELTGGAEFNSPKQKVMHAHYLRNSIVVESDDLTEVKQLCAQRGIACYLGTIERAPDRGGKSLYCSMIYIDRAGQVGSVHRKLMPTFEERLTWSPGDGHGLRVHSLPPFTVGGLNCWENWMPLARASLYAQGEDLHVAIWPGGEHNTRDLTRFIAKESRSFVMSVSGLMRAEDFPSDTPSLDEILAHNKEFYANGGSCIAAPDGRWLIEPLIGEEAVQTASIDYAEVLQERQNFDPNGHYSRPDVTRLVVNRERQAIAEFSED